MLAAMMQRSLAGLSAATVPHRAAALQQVRVGDSRLPLAKSRA
jgi:hypothetical protein